MDIIEKLKKDGFKITRETKMGEIQDLLQEIEKRNDKWYICPRISIYADFSGNAIIYNKENEAEEIPIGNRGK